MRYHAGTWEPENHEEVALLKQPSIRKKLILSPMTRKTIKVPVADNPTPLAIGYIILQNGIFIEVPRHMYHPIFFSNFIKLYTGKEIEFQNYMEQIDYFNQELQHGIYIIDYGMGDGSESLHKGRLFLPTKKNRDSFLDSIYQFDQISKDKDFQIIYVHDREEYQSLDEVLNLKQK